MYEITRRLDFSKTGIFNALKRISISPKKTLAHLKVFQSEDMSKLDSFTQQSYPIFPTDESGFEAERPYSYARIDIPYVINSYN